jgi:hypothetical protein
VPGAIDAVFKLIERVFYMWQSAPSRLSRSGRCLDPGQLDGVDFFGGELVGSDAVCGDGLAEAAECSVQPSANAAEVYVFGQWAGMLYDAEEAELRRRARAKLGAVTCPDLFVALLTVSMALVAVRDWRRGLDGASRFTPFCSTILALPQVTGNRSRMLIEAAYYGVGVAVATASGPKNDRGASAVRQFRKPAAWWFAEEIHSQVGADGRPCARPPLIAIRILRPRF